MAWVAIETFSGYSDGNLSGNNGGSGWSNAWQASTPEFQVQGTTVYEGAKAVSCASAGGSNPFQTRNLTTSISTSGVVYVAIRRNSTSTGELSFTLRNSSNGARVSVKLNASGNMTLGGTTTVTVITGYTANQWYVARITFNVAGNSATMAYSTGTYGGGGTYSSESSAVTMTNSGDVDQVGLGGDGGSTIYYDYISGTDPLPSLVNKGAGFLNFM